jgi:pilus assembly protein CpaE
MKEVTTILLSGRSRSNLGKIGGGLRGQPGFDIHTKLIENGYADPLHGVTRIPDILLLDLSTMWQEELGALSNRGALDRPPLIAIGADGDSQVMRLAMQVGARDFFTHPVTPKELLSSLQQIARDSQQEVRSSHGIQTAVINAKGGSGASFLACNLAHIMAVNLQLRVALLDLDLQFGTLPLYFDVTPRNSLLDALGAVEQLDPIALEGYMTRYGSRLRLLSSMSDQMPLPWEISPRHLNRLLDIALLGYDHIVLDLPRIIDPLTTSIIERADNVLVVMQQSITHIRDAKRLLRIITGDLGVPHKSIRVVINRHHNKNPIREQDIQEALSGLAVIPVENDFKRVSEAIDLGVPLLENGSHGGITKTLIKLATELCGNPDKHNNGFFKNALAHIFGA